MTEPSPAPAEIETKPDSSGEAAVRLVNVHKGFADQPVLRGVSIDFRRGQTTVVMGPSGSGKSVLLKHTIGLLRPDRGQVWYEDTRIDRLSEGKLGPIRQEFGVLFQHGALFDSMNVEANVAFPLVEHRRDMSKQRRRDRVREVLNMVGLADTMHQMPAELSGGQRKRVALARAIVLEPKVVLYDEPTTGLDPIRSDVINELILKLKRELAVTSIVVTHDLTSAFKVADWMVMLHDGHVLLEGPPDVFRTSDVPVVRRFLAGEASREEVSEIERHGMGRLSPQGSGAARGDAG